MVQLPLFQECEANYFTEDKIPEDWDKRIYIRSCPEDLDWMEVIKPLPCGEGFVPVGFKYNGASSGIFSKLIILNFPKWKHRIATCRHDWRCALADTKEKRAFADKRFKKDVSVGGTWWEKQKGYVGVRIGAMFGVGSPPDKKEDPMLKAPKTAMQRLKKDALSADHVDIETG